MNGFGKYLCAKVAQVNMYKLLCNFFMGKLEAHAKEDAPFKHTSGEPIFMVWTEREDSLQIFTNCCLHISYVIVIL